MEEAFCQGCHVNGANTPHFMATDSDHPEVYDQVVEWNQDSATPLINFMNPGDSRLLNKGPHEGSRWWTDDERQRIAPWITAESDFARVSDQIATPALLIPYGEVVIDLEAEGLLSEAPGATLRFIYSRQSSVLRFDELTITAGPGGLRIVDPTIVPVVDDLPMVDPTFVPMSAGIDAPEGVPTEIFGGIVISAHLDGVLTDQSDLKIAFLFGDLQPL